jgi:poly(A) polymerase
MSEDAAPGSNKPLSTREDALAIVRRLRDAGHVAYFAGGCVRDALLGLTPKDYDVATDAPPDTVRALFARTQAVGVAFGVILVRQGRSQVEVATFRSDGKYVDGRRPDSVVFTNAEEDAKRRDFTINGMFYDPLEDKVIDFVGGQRDVREHVLRAIGNADARFEEDHLRLLRAIRFAARFDLEVEPETWSAIGRHMGHLVRISPERVGDELRMMLAPPTRAAAWGMLGDRGFEGILFRFVKLPWAASQDRVLAEFSSVFDAVRPRQPIPFGLAMAAASLDWMQFLMPADVGFRDVLSPAVVNDIARGLRQALKLSNEETDDLRGALEGLQILLADRQHTVAELKRFLARPTARMSRDLLAGVQSDAAVESRLHEFEKNDFTPPPLITGDDLTAGGLKPGPAFKRALDAAYDAQLEGRVTTREQALELAARMAKERK